MNLADATDHDLLIAGIISVRSVQRHGPLLSPFWCDHDWSGPRQDLEDDAYCVCHECGAIKPGDGLTIEGSATPVYLSLPAPRR